MLVKPGIAWYPRKEVSTGFVFGSRAKRIQIPRRHSSMSAGASFASNTISPAIHN